MDSIVTSILTSQQGSPESATRGGEPEATAAGGLRLPRFIIIGAPKAATTWLSSVLRRQPYLFVPGPEIHFYNRNYEKGLAWYASNFSGAEPSQIVGEKSASYLADPRVPARIRATLPDVRLIAQLRNPIERAYSDYCMLLRRGEVDADVERYLDPTRAPTRRFIDDGLYGRHLAAFLEVFPRARLHVLFYEDVASDPRGVFAGVASFLGLVDPVPPEEVNRRVKDKETPMLPLPVRRALRPLKSAVRPIRGLALFRQVHRLLVRPVRYPLLAARTRERLADYYADDVRALGRLVGRDLGGWLKPSVGAAEPRASYRGA